MGRKTKKLKAEIKRLSAENAALSTACDGLAGEVAEWRRRCERSNDVRGLLVEQRLALRHEYVRRAAEVAGRDVDRVLDTTREAHREHLLHEALRQEAE